MIGETLPEPVREIDRYLIRDDELQDSPQHLPDAGWLEVEMKISLNDGTEVLVKEQVARMSDLGEALDRARFRLAVTFARDMLDAPASGAPQIAAAY
jgi:hypothetical protein